MTRQTRQAATKASGKVRIIAGRWRGSRLDIPEVAGLRPTPDRVRETLFNWLQGHIAGLRCLDLYAGSGALGFEAASRGAAHVVMVERDHDAVAALLASAHRLQAANVDIIHADALTWLARPTLRFDVAFIDPPFAAGLHQRTLDLLSPWLAPGAQVYVEYGRAEPRPVLAGFTVWREGSTREVHYCLLRRMQTPPDADSPATLEIPPDAEPATKA